MQHVHTSLCPLCDIPSGCCFFTGPWTATCSSLRMLPRVAVFCRPLRPVFLLVSFSRWRSPSSWRTGAVLLPAGVISQPLLPTLLRILVVHHLPRCIPVGMWSIGLLFLDEALDSSRAASGRCVLAAAAASVPAGVVSAPAEPSGWHTGGVLVGAGVPPPQRAELSIALAVSGPHCRGRYRENIIRLRN